MTGRMSRWRPLPQEDLPRVALEEERFGDEQAVEHLDDVAVLQHELRPAGPGVIPVPERLRFADDLVLRECGAIHRLRAEKAHHGAAGPQHADDLARERSGGRRLEKIEDVPAQYAVDALVG